MERAQQRGKGISNVARKCVVRPRSNGMGSDKSHTATGAHVDGCMAERYARRRAHDGTWRQASRQGVAWGDCVDMNDGRGPPRDAVYHGITYMAW